MAVSFPLTHPVLVLATVMLIVLLAPPLVRKLGLPGLVGPSWDRTRCWRTRWLRASALRRTPPSPW